MTLALVSYSGVFMRYALAVTPKNWLLFGCHIVNFSAQTTQGYRYLNYWHMGGRDLTLKEEAKKAGGRMDQEAGKLAEGAKEGLRKTEGKVEATAERIKGQ